MSGSWSVGPCIAGAAALAVERINANKTLLPGHVLEYSWEDSGCHAKQALAGIGKLLKTRTDVVIGPACSEACEVTSYLSEGQDIPQISYSCFAPSLSDKSTYKLVSLVGKMTYKPCCVYSSLFAVFENSGTIHKQNSGTDRPDAPILVEEGGHSNKYRRLGIGLWTYCPKWPH